jgi:hypothetical protein
MGRLDLEALGGPIGSIEPAAGASMAAALARAGYRPTPGAPVAARRRRSAKPAESLDAVFGAGPFSHQLVLKLDWSSGALDELTHAIGEAGAALQAMNVSELDGGFSAKIWIKGVSCDAARRLSDRLAALPPVSYAHVEHHLGRTPTV